jgi:general L-amino acid transport system permease protein
MSIEAREPPSQFVFRLRRALGGRAGWSGLVYQLLFVAALIWLGYEIVANAKANLAAQRITSGFGFLENNAGFDVNQTLIPFSGSDSYIRVFFVGLLNTLVVAVVGIFFATILGFSVALGRLSPNWLLSRIAGGYVELVRNLPPLFQILFWYKAVLSALPNPRQSYSVFGFVFPCEWGVDWVTRLLGSYCTAAPDSSPSWLHGFFLSNRGLVVPKPVAAAGLEPFLIAAAIGIVAAVVLRRYARKELFDKGRKIKIWPYVLGLIIGLPWLAILIFGIPFTLEIPALRGFNFSGGSRIIPEFVALTLALSTYTAAFIAEIVRAGIMSVHKGQMEAGSSLGLSRGQTLRMIVVPQAMRVILPPLTNQYLNLTKNSSLAVAIGYPDLVQIFTGTVLNQTNRSVEIVAITMAVYLIISLVTALLMNLYNARMALAER